MFIFLWTLHSRLQKQLFFHKVLHAFRWNLIGDGFYDKDRNKCHHVQFLFSYWVSFFFLSILLSNLCRHVCLKEFLFCLHVHMWLLCRGRYDIKMYPTFLQLHGKTFDYKIPYTTILRLFLLPHKDGRQMFFVVCISYYTLSVLVSSDQLVSCIPVALR